jgi:carbonic anhydrase
VPIRPEKILHQLILGNQRFAEGQSKRSSQVTRAKRLKLADVGQSPLATVLTCSDSRLPVEMVFDADIGDLFVVRNAGNIVSHSVLASMELAILNFGINLCLVLGHSQCGAVDTAIRFHRSQNAPTEHIRNMIAAILPLVQSQLTDKPTDFEKVDDIVRSNVEHSCSELVSGSPLLRDYVEKGKLHIVGAVYNIKSGLVSFV